MDSNVCSSDWSSDLHSWTTECMGPTPPRMPGSWFFLMSVSHSVTAYWMTLSTPRRLKMQMHCLLNYLLIKQSRGSIWYVIVSAHPCRQQSLFNFNSEQFNWASPIRIPANVPCEAAKTLDVWDFIAVYVTQPQWRMSCCSTLTCSMTTCLPW